MKKILLSTVCAISFGLCASAFAADLPIRKAMPMADAAYNWTGFYIGGNVGGGMSSKRWEIFDDFASSPPGLFAFTSPPAFFDEGRHSATGALGGGQIGYRWQGGTWVFGLEAQGDWANLRGENISIDSFRFTNQTRINSMGMFTAQLGYTWYDALIYVKGGAIVLNERYNVYDSFAGGLVASKNDDRWGGTIGVGIEYGFTPNWSAGIEYNHGFLGTRTYDFTDAVFGGIYQTERIRQDLDMVTLRLNYKFGAAPVVARY